LTRLTWASWSKRSRGPRGAGQKQGEAGGARRRARKSANGNNSLTLWKDADSDIPIYKQAEAEYEKLR
jgi:hypothetical protein